MATRAVPTEAAFSFLRSTVAQRVALATAVVGGAAIRAGLLAAGISPLDADQAVPGIMARRILHGQDTYVFYAGQHYMGAFEQYLQALSLAVLPDNAFTLRLPELILSSATTLLVYLVGVRILGTPWRATLAAALYAIGPYFNLLFGIKSAGALAVGTFVGLLAVYVVLLLEPRSRWNLWLAAAFGLCCGFAFWEVWSMAFVLVPAAIWAVGSARGDLRRLAPAAAVGFAIGALPVWLWAVKNGHIPTPLDAPITEASTLFQRSDNLTDAMVPMLFGVKLTDGAPVAGWLPSSLVVWALVAAFGVGLWKRRLGLWALARGSRTRREPIDLLLLVFVALPVFWLASRFAFFAGEPRYLQPIAPMISIGLAALVPRETRTAAIAVGATLLAALALVTGLAVNKVFALPDQVGGVAERCLPQVVSALQGKGVRSAYADYWVAYPLQWEADRKLTFAPTYASRFPDLTAQVDADPHAAYVAPVGPVADKIAAALKARHAKATRSDTCSVALFTGFRHTPKPPELGLP